MCVSISPYSFYTPDSPICGLAASPHMPLWNGNKLKSHIKESMKTSEFRFFKSQPPTSLPPFVFNRKHSITFVHENCIMARAFKIQLFKAHSMASKSRFWKIGPNSVESYISRRAVSCRIRICACFWREMSGSSDNVRFLRMVALVLTVC